MDDCCAICGKPNHLDQHHVVPRRMGGSTNPSVLDDANLVTLRRPCHANLHEGRWILERQANVLRVLDARTGTQVMRRRSDPDIDASDLLQLLGHAATSLSFLLPALPFFSDEQLVEAFAGSRAFGKRAWLLQAAILAEAQQRSIYGDQTLSAVAQRFDISLRQAEKYAAVWQTFFSKPDQEQEEENVNIDEIALEEPSWYLVAASETKAPHAWLAYAQDRKLEDARYTVAALRRDIRAARLQESIGEARAGRQLANEVEVERWACPWVRLYCTRSGRPMPLVDCDGCRELEKQNCKTKPTGGAGG